MSEIPDVKLSQRITVGSKGAKEAIVCKIYDNMAVDGIEIVYLDERNRAINEDVIWKEDRWIFKDPDSGGGYAGRIDRLSKYVNILRRRL